MLGDQQRPSFSHALEAKQFRVDAIHGSPPYHAPVATVAGNASS